MERWNKVGILRSSHLPLTTPDSKGQTEGQSAFNALLKLQGTEEGLEYHEDHQITLEMLQIPTKP